MGHNMSQTKIIHVRLPQWLAGAMEEIADKEMISTTAAVRKACGEYTEKRGKLPPTQKKKAA
jgi:hypothetical protein